MSDPKPPPRILVNGEEKPPAKKIRASDVGLDVEQAIRQAREALKK